MEKKLLLPTDFSKNSWNAIQYAIKLYEHNACDFYILNTYSKDVHSIDSNILLDPDEAFNKFSEKQSLQRLGDIMSRLTFNYNNPKHRFHVLSRASLFQDAIKEIVEHMKIDMIILGAKGMTNEREGEYGKNTLAVIETIRNCPVLVIPLNVSFELPKEIVLATNFDCSFKNDEVKFLAEIARLSNASIQVLSHTENGALSLKQKKNKKRLKKRLIGVAHSFDIMHNLNMETALSSYIKIRHSNMISYIDKKRSFWERFGFGKSTLRKLGYFDNLPVLALHE